MKTLTFILIAITGLTNTCDDKQSNSSNINQQSPEKPVDAGATSSDFIGMDTTSSQSFADKNNIPFRIVRLDGNPMAATSDYRPRWINAVVSDGIITEISIEGQLDEIMQAPTKGETSEELTCYDGNTISVTTGEYMQGDAITATPPDHIIIADNQTHTSYMLKQVTLIRWESSGDKMVYYQGSGGSTLEKDGMVLYSGCE